MRYLIIILILAPLAGISSCDLFGSKNGDDPAGGEVVWRLENNSENTVGTQPLIEGDRVYFIQDGQLKAVTLKEGNMVWRKTIDQRGEGDYTHKIIDNNNLIFIDQGFKIMAFKKSDGRLIWNTNITDDAKEVSGIGEPIMSQDETYLYAGRKGYVVKLRKSDGKEVMRYPLDRMVPEGIVQGSTEPVISPFGDDILYAPASYFDNSQPTPEEAGGGNVFAFDANSGNLIWEHQITVTVPDRSTPAPDDSLTGSPLIFDIGITKNKVIVLAGFYIVALDRQTGESVWQTYFSRGGFDVGLAIEGNGVYAASIGRFATRVDLQTGDVQWTQDIKFSNTSIPTVQNGRMYFNNSGGGGIWVLDTEDGSVIYNQRPPNYRNDSFDVYISSLGVGEGYMVNVGSKAVYCLKVP